MKLSARNQLPGLVKKISLGPISAEVTLSLPGNLEIVSVITRSAAERLNLQESQPAIAVVKASSVILAVE
ncbi:MAG: TOBE domain-containing protein [Phycisphaeraceae bacterium]|nr:TOBE domain-containing protein [Phycisphaeraceae bacterium]